MSNSLQLHGLQPTRLLFPWDFPGKNTRVSSRFLLQGIFPTQGWNLHLLHWQTGGLHMSHLGSSQQNLRTLKIRSCLTTEICTFLYPLLHVDNIILSPLFQSFKKKKNLLSIHYVPYIEKRLEWLKKLCSLFMELSV